MEQETIMVGLAEIKVAKAPDQLSCLGLGSCVAVCVYYPPAKIGGIAHIMLPSSSMISNSNQPTNPAKFADTAIPFLVDAIEKLGGNQNQFIFKIAGGAQMFATSSPDERLSIGLKNIAAVEEVCDKLGYKIVAKVVGGTTGKSVIMNLNTGIVQIRTLSESVFI